MLKKEDIEQFYKDVNRLGLKFPVAAISEATGQSKSNVSKYLNRKLEPSESFLSAFYGKFPNGGKNVSRENKNEDLGVIRAKIDVLFDVAVEVISATSGENQTLVRKKLEKRVDDLRKFSGD